MKFARASRGVASPSAGHAPLIASTQRVRDENRGTLASSSRVMENKCDLVRGEGGEGVEGEGVEECSLCQNPPYSSSFVVR